MAEHVEEWMLFSDGNYAVSNLGSVRRETPGRRTQAGRALNPISQTCGYYSVRPVEYGKNVHRYVHHLVAKAFVAGETRERSHVNHIDGNKHNNAAANLEWVTRRENMEHAARTGLMVRGESHPGSRFRSTDIADIRARRSAGETFEAIALAYKASLATVYNIVTRKSWSHIP